MTTGRIMGKGTALKIFSFIEEIGIDGKYIITVIDEHGNPECNGYGSTRVDAVSDLHQKGFDVILDRFDKGDKTNWRTRRY